MSELVDLAEKHGTLNCFRNRILMGDCAHSVDNNGAPEIIKVCTCISASAKEKPSESCVSGSLDFLLPRMDQIQGLPILQAPCHQGHVLQGLNTWAPTPNTHTHSNTPYVCVCVCI